MAPSNLVNTNPPRHLIEGVELQGDGTCLLLCAAPLRFLIDLGNLPVPAIGEHAVLRAAAVSGPLSPSLLVEGRVYALLPLALFPSTNPGQ